MLEITESDDLATLTKLDEQVLVDRLHERYDDDKIYVRSRGRYWGEEEGSGLGRATAAHAATG